MTALLKLKEVCDILVNHSVDTRPLIFRVGTGWIGRICCSARDSKTIFMSPLRIYMTAYVMEIKRPKLYRLTGNILLRKERILYIYIYIHTYILLYGDGFNRYSTAWGVYVVCKNTVSAKKHSVEQFYLRIQICKTSY